MRRVFFEINDIRFTATISNSKTANAVYDSLPCTGTVQRWGDEIMFSIPVKLNEDANATANVEIGDLAYSTTDSSLCIFFGKTPFSSGKKPKAHNLVNVFGKIEGSTDLLKGIKSQSPVKVNKFEIPKTEKSSTASKGQVIPIWRETA